MLTVTLYTQKDCRLCAQTRADLEALQAGYPHVLVEVDIESEPALQRAYGSEIPVVEVGPYRLKSPFTRRELAMTLGAAGHRRDQLERPDSLNYRARMQRGRWASPRAPSRAVSGADRAFYWFSRRYLAVVNLILLLYVGLPFIAPLLMKAGEAGSSPAVRQVAASAASLIYLGYSPLCHQLGFRSFYLFGEQAFYPLAEAGLTGVVDFERASGITGLRDPYSPARLEARSFKGNESMGYKVALCERDVAIYASLLLFGLLFALTGRRLRSIHWMVWLVLGLGPIGLDGFSQLFSQFEWPLLAGVLPYRESTPWLRMLTGALFGFFTAWFGFPSIEESMQETRRLFVKKFSAAKALAD